MLLLGLTKGPQGSKVTQPKKDKRKRQHNKGTGHRVVTGEQWEGSGGKG